MDEPLGSRGGALAPQSTTPEQGSPDNGQLGGLDGASLEPAQRIFVNRNLRFDSIRVIGFDMDYTLAPYQKREMEELSFELTKQRLVEKHGYPQPILGIRYDPSFVVRGLVVDKKLGNIFKMDAHNHVGRVYHGRRALTKEERRELYRNVKIRLTAPKYHWIDTLFALPEGVLYADIIELLEVQMGNARVPYWDLFDAIRTSIDECHRDGSLKAVVKSDLARYIEADRELAPALHKLRSAGKRLFLLTNSLWDYTHAVMSFVLDGKLPEYPSWTRFFDVVVVGASKPDFFTKDAPFRRISPDTGLPSLEPVTRFERHGVYQGGSIERFEQLFNDGGDSCLYVGDHIYGDIIRSKKDSLWRTALILEELERELRLSTRLKPLQDELHLIEEQRATLDHEVTTLKLKVSAVEAALDDRPRSPDEVEDLSRARRLLRASLDEKRRTLKQQIDRRDELSGLIEHSYNPFWGSVFKEGSDNSRFGEQVEDYACIYTSRVSNFLRYSPSQYFRAPRHWMPHEKH